MRLYPKRLRNIEDLEKEQALLVKKSRELEKEDILSVEGLLGKKKSKDGNKESSLLDLLPVSNPIVNLLVKLVQRRLAKKEKPPRTAYAPPPPTKEKPRKNRLKSIAVEFIGGYLKWKAIELSYNGIRRLIRAGREKRAANA